MRTPCRASQRTPVDFPRVHPSTGSEPINGNASIHKLTSVFEPTPCSASSA